MLSSIFHSKTVHKAGALLIGKITLKALLIFYMLPALRGRIVTALRKLIPTVLFLLCKSFLSLGRNSVGDVLVQFLNGFGASIMGMRSLSLLL